MNQLSICNPATGALITQVAADDAVSVAGRTGVQLAVIKSYGLHEAVSPSFCALAELHWAP